MNRYILGIVIAGVVVLAGGAAALYRNINSGDKTEKVIYYSETQRMMYPEIELGKQEEKEAADDVQEMVEINAAVNAAYIPGNDENSNAGFMTADNADVSLTDKKEEAASGATQTASDNPKPGAATSGSTQSNPKPSAAQPVPAAPANTPAQSNPKPEAAQPSEATTEKTTEAVWVVDVPAWTEEVPIYDYVQIAVCSGCGADISGHANEHIMADMYDECGGYHSEMKEVYMGIETVYHEEEGHYEYR